MPVELSRRTFFFGAAASAAALSIPGALASQVMGETVYVPLSQKLGYRAMCDFVFSAMPAEGGVDDTVQWTFARNGNTFFVMAMNARATFRWVAVPGSEVEFMKGDILSMTLDMVRPTTVTSLTIMSDIEKDKSPLVRRKMFTETFRWKGIKLDLCNIDACHFADSHLLA